MPMDQQNVKVLTDVKGCKRAARGDPLKMAACDATFAAATRTVTATGGRVF
jgi:hypothetical protein